VSLVRRGLTVFEHIIVAVARDTTKSPLFSLSERVEMAHEVFADNPAVSVEGFSGLLVNYVRSRGARVVLRGLRAVSDFEYEFQMALMNRKLERQVQTMFLMTDYRWMYLSSTIIKEAGKHGGNIRHLVPDLVLHRINARFDELSREAPRKP